MKIKFNFIAAASGKEGGIVAAKNKGGQYFRNFSVPLNPDTPAQTVVKNRLVGFSQNWQSLTEAQRLSWANFAELHPRTNPLGDVRHLSGFQVYVSANNNIANGAGVAIDVAPASAAVPAITDLSLVADGSGPNAFDVTFAPTPVPADTTMVIQATLPLSPGIKNANNKFRQIAIETAGAASDLDLLLEYESKFGTLISGQQIQIRAYNINLLTGIVSLALKATTITL